MIKQTWVIPSHSDDGWFCILEYEKKIPVEEHDAKIREDAIDELLYEIDECNAIGISDEEFNIIKNMAEQIKENKNERRNAK